jgi:Sulfatase
MIRQVKEYLPGFIALVLTSFLLVAPNRLVSLSISDLLLFPGELPLLVLVLLIPGSYGFLLRWLLAVVLALGTILKAADIGTFQVFARPFNPVFDFYFVTNGMNLLDGSLGKTKAAVIAFLLLVLLAAIVWIAFWLLGKLQLLLLKNSRKSLRASIALLLIWLVLFFAGWNRASFPFYQHLYSHTNEITTALDDLKNFRHQIESYPQPHYPSGSLFSRLQGKDVLVIFVESYGRTLLDKPEFSKHIRPLLQNISNQLSAKGFMQRSSYLTSPTQGGLSWLAHGTAMSGLWIDNQIRYNNLMISQQPTLNRMFKQAGWRTLAVMPAITMAWPEGNYYGYDYIYQADNLGYQGKPFNWVTMPDQYTLFSLQTRELEKKTRAPIMAEIALISSHAPWTPVPHLVDWNRIGNGEIFNVQASSGDSPEKVWQDNDRIRLQYRLSIEYAMQTLASFIENYGTKNTVILVLGDHQPAPLVTGVDNNRDVPVHFITADRNIIESINHWQWTTGLIPDDNISVMPMNELKNQWIKTFSK